MAPRSFVALLLTLALASCTITPSPTASATAPPPSGSGSSGPAVQPGRPYDADAVLQAMRDSRRPGGVPEALQTDEIAAAVAAELWTFDGRPWPQLVIGGACGPAICTLDVAGTPSAAAGSDLYSLSVDPDAASVTLDSGDLHGYPAALDGGLAEAGQAALGDRIRGLAYTGARWLPPPDAGRFWVSYRSGGEEGSPGLDVLLEPATGEVLEIRPIR
jgi:hypothetical protein